MRLAFIKLRSFRVGFIRGYRYHNYTTNWAKTKEILREWGSKLREWLKKGGEPSQALPRQLSRRESQAITFIAKVLGIMRKLSAVLLPLPLGEVASPTGLDGEGARCYVRC